MKQAFAKNILTLGVLVVITAGAWGQSKYYRYTNKDGVTVMSITIPSEYVKNGYEIVTLSGQVLEVIEPAPSPEEAEKAAAQRQRALELEKWDDYLLKRYSTVDDIEEAKQRKLDDFEASLSILRGNANNIRTQIEQVQARAANIERSGREIPESTLNSLQALELELQDTQEQLALREVEKGELAQKYDADIDRFKVILSQKK